MQAPRPARSPLVAGSNRRICSDAGLAGRREGRGARRVAGAAVAAHRDAVAGDDEFIADRDRALGARERRWSEGRRKRRGELEERHVGGGPMGEQRREVELRMPRDRRDVLELGLVRGVEDDELVVGARRHAMRRREHEIARDRNAAA